MEELIEQYLFQHKSCPLPAVGSLQIMDGSAVAWHGDNKMSAPLPHVELSNVEIPADHFIAFIALKKNIPVGEASVSLQKYCLGLQKMKSFNEVILPHTGRFHVNEGDVLVFKQDPIPKEFLPSVRFQRVSHSSVASHAIRVGDTETTNKLMAEFYSDKEKPKKDKWWIAAIILGVAAAAILFVYFKDHSYRENFGNTKSFESASPVKTYSTN